MGIPWAGIWGRKGYQYDNTRQWIRLPAAWPVKAGFQIAESIDVGAGGISMILPQNVPVGSRLPLEIYTPPLERSVRAEGQVIRSIPSEKTGCTVGVLFVRIDPQDQQALNETVERFYRPRERTRQQKGIWWRALP